MARETLKILERLEEAERVLALRVEESFLKLIEADYDEEDWRVVYDESKGGRTELIDPLDIAEMRSKIRWSYWMGNGHLRRIVRNSINYVVGPGMKFTPLGIEDKKIKSIVVAHWQQWSDLNNWPSKQRETVERGNLDGEIFYRWRNDDRLVLRFLEPEDISDPTPGTKWNLGIEYDELDVENVIKYAWNPKHKTDAPEAWLDSVEIQHIFWFGTKSMLRGIPPHIPVMHRIKQYDGWLTDRLILNKLRARIALLRKHAAASPGQIKAFADRTKDGETRRSAKTDERTDRRRMFKAGTVIDTNARTTYEFLSPNVQASDVRHDGRNILLAIATAVGQSEVMVSADASNANFASTWIAEAPAVKEFQLYQSVLMAEFNKVWHRVMSHGQDTGAIPASPDRNDQTEYSGYDVMIEPPRLIGRDRLNDTKADALMYDAEALSKKTWQMRDGLDPEVEDKNVLEQEAETVGLGHEPEIGNEDEDEDEDENEKNKEEEET